MVDRIYTVSNTRVRRYRTYISSLETDHASGKGRSSRETLLLLDIISEIDDEESQYNVERQRGGTK